MRKKQNKIIGAVLILVSIALLVRAGFEITNTRESREGRNSVEQILDHESGAVIEEAKVVEIDVSSQSTAESETKLRTHATLKLGEENFDLKLLPDSTVYDAMQILKSEGKISFEGKNYPGLGFFVTSINSLASGDGKNLMYYINGEEASLGISSYIIKEGDEIEWKLN